MEDDVFCTYCNKRFRFNDLPIDKLVYCPDCGQKATRGIKDAPIENKRGFVSSKKLLLIIAVVVISVLIVISLYLTDILRNPPMRVPINNKTGNVLSSQPKESNTFLTYENSTYGIKVQYPSKWINLGGSTSNKLSRIVVHFAPAELNPVFYVETKDNSKGLNLQQVLANLSGSQNSKDFKVTKSTIHSSLGGFPAYEFSTMHLDNNSHFEYSDTEIGAVVGNKIYVISYSIPIDNQSSKYASMIQKMVNSFEIYNSTQPITTKNQPARTVNQFVSSSQQIPHLEHDNRAGTANQLEQMGNNSIYLHGGSDINKKSNLSQGLSNENNRTLGSNATNYYTQKQPQPAPSISNSSISVTKNRPPVANAGQDEVDRPGDSVLLDGVSSRDPDNDPITYRWIQVAGPPVDLVDANTSLPLFRAPTIPSDTNLTFRLVVTDNKNASGTDDVVVTDRRIPLSNSGTYNLKIEGINYPINYQITGKGNSLDNITTDSDILKIDITSSSQGIFTIELPRSLIDSKDSGTSNDSNFTVLLDNESMASLNEISKTQINRTLTFNFPKGIQQFEISGSSTVPNNLTTNQTQPLPVSKSGYDRGCNDAKIPNPSDRYINQSGKGPRDHSSEFMRQYKKGFSDCSKGISPGQLPNLSTCKNEIVPGIGEINTSPTGHGLRINVGIAGATDGSHPTRINVTEPSGETLCKDIELTAADQSLLFYFYPEVIPNGQHFEACITLLDTNKKSCVEGVNHQSRSSESVQLDPPI